MKYTCQCGRVHVLPREGGHVECKCGRSCTLSYDGHRVSITDSRIFGEILSTITVKGRFQER